MIYHLQRYLHGTWKGKCLFVQPDLPYLVLLSTEYCIVHSGIWESWWEVHSVWFYKKRLNFVQHSGFVYIQEKDDSKNFKNGRTILYPSFSEKFRFSSYNIDPCLNFFYLPNYAWICKHKRINHLLLHITYVIFPSSPWNFLPFLH